MATYTYKCPNCTGPLLYRPDLEKLKCDYCGSSFTTEEIDAYIKNNPDKEMLIEDEGSEKKPSVVLKTQEGLERDQRNQEYEIKGYNCSNCGAEVVTSATSLTTFCYYCHSPVVLTDRTQGAFRPDKLIPFAIDKKKVEESLLAWIKRKKYVKRDFYSQSQLEKITGMYLPFWSMNSNYEIRLKGKGKRLSTSRSGNTEYIETSFFDIDRAFNYQVDNLSKLAYTKVDGDFINSISPFNFKDKKDFKIFYLNGFFSETYDLTFDDLKQDLVQRTQEYVKNRVKSELYDYDSYELSEESYDRLAYEKEYVLLPVWMLTYDYKGKKYIYTMNGQTGKAFGDLPIDQGLIFRDSLIIAIIVFILAILGGRFIW
ncbi:MAG: hypothetical protein Q4E50_03170 [Tissierellia bacterium]|nr:hypothetical protein [Tissierellia bacterium]